MVSTSPGILQDAFWAWKILYSVFPAAAEGTGIREVALECRPDLSQPSDVCGFVVEFLADL